MVQEMQVSDVRRYRSSTMFQNPMADVGNIVWVRVTDENGMHEFPVKVVADEV